MLSHLLLFLLIIFDVFLFDGAQSNSDYIKQLTQKKGVTLHVKDFQVFIEIIRFLRKSSHVATLSRFSFVIGGRSDVRCVGIHNELLTM